MALPPVGSLSPGPGISFGFHQGEGRDPYNTGRVLGMRKARQRLSQNLVQVAVMWSRGLRPGRQIMKFEGTFMLPNLRIFSLARLSHEVFACEGGLEG